MAAILKQLLQEEKLQKVAAEDQKLSHAAYTKLEKQLALALMPAGDLMTQLRASKDAEEIAFMKQSQAISEKALDETLQVIRPGMSEKEVASELVYRMLRSGSEGNAFFLTMDFGSLKGGYCSDMTRTVAVCSSTEEMRHIYAVVLEAQLAGIRAAKSGIPGCEIDAAARRVIQDAGFGSCFGHGFGHSLGLDIHERPNLNPREKTPMPENAVVSAEPGIYLPGRFGVRIEDVMILRSDGSEVITKAPKDSLLTVG